LTPILKGVDKTNNFIFFIFLNRKREKFRKIEDNNVNFKEYYIIFKLKKKKKYGILRRIPSENHKSGGITLEDPHSFN